MKTVSVASGESQQINGPWFGVRVVSYGTGAAIRLDFGEWLPLVGAFTLPAPAGRPFERVNLTGPITIQLAEAPDEDLRATVTAPPPPTSDDVAGYVRIDAARSAGFDWGGLAVWRETLVRPAGMRSLWLTFACRGASPRIFPWWSAIDVGGGSWGQILAWVEGVADGLEAAPVHVGGAPALIDDPRGATYGFGNYRQFFLGDWSPGFTTDGTSGAVWTPSMFDKVNVAFRLNTGAAGAAIPADAYIQVNYRWRP